MSYPTQLQVAHHYWWRLGVCADLTALNDYQEIEICLVKTFLPHPARCTYGDGTIDQHNLDAAFVAF